MTLRSYRAVSAGQSLGDAATIQFDWTGNTLRPLSPSNLRITRNAASDILIEWTRRSRIAGGMIPGSDVPLAEEQEIYEVEILTSANAVLSTIKIHPNQANPAVLIPASDDLDAPFVSSNNILDPGVNSALAYTQQQLGVGSWIEARLNAELIDHAAIGVVEPTNAKFLRQGGVGWPLSTFRSEVQFGDNNTDGSNDFRVYHGLGGPSFPPVLYTSPSLGAVRSARIRVEVGDRLRYYWDYTGSGSVPFFESDAPPPVPLVGVVACLNISNTGCSINDVQIGATFRPSTVYTAAQQAAHSGTGVKARVYQVSAIVGRGPYAEITF
jgi:hypothetical protein